MSEETSRMTFGLRHLKTGKFLRVVSQSNAGQDFCNEYTWTLTESDGNPRFECDTLGKLIAAMAEDVPWFNSESDRPCHGGYRMEDCEPWAFVRTEAYDRAGGDPVTVREESARVLLPSFVRGEIMKSVEPKKPLLFETFPVAADFGEDAWPFVCLVRPEGPIEPGMIVTNGFSGAFGVVVADAPVPTRWPVDPGRPFDKKDPSWRLILARGDLLRDPEFARSCIEQEPESPSPAIR